MNTWRDYEVKLGRDEPEQVELSIPANGRPEAMKLLRQIVRPEFLRYVEIDGKHAEPFRPDDTVAVLEPAVLRGRAKLVRVRAPGEYVVRMGHTEHVASVVRFWDDHHGG